jgi:hypothetical protein
MMLTVNIENLYKAGMIPRVHPNGFIQLDLTEDARTRLHVWPDTPLVAQKSHLYHMVHDHKFVMTSTVLCGRIDNLTYVMSLPFRDDYLVYEGNYANRHDSVLVKTGLKGVLVAREVSSHMPNFNPTYRLPAQVLHATFAHGLTATVMQSGGALMSYKPRVIVPKGVIVDNDYDRHSYDQAYLWGWIRRALKEAQTQAPAKQLFQVA